MGILILFFQWLEFWPYSPKQWNSDSILPIIGILTLSFQTLEFSTYPFKHWKCDLNLTNIGILSLLFQTLESWLYRSKHWNSDLILPNTGILTLSFHILEFWPYPFKHWNSDLFVPNIGILTYLFQTLEFWPCPSTGPIQYPKLSRLEEQGFLMVEVSLVKESKVICSLDSFLELFTYCCHPGCANQAIIKHHTIGLTLIVNWKCRSGQ